MAVHNKQNLIVDIRHAVITALVTYLFFLSLIWSISWFVGLNDMWGVLYYSQTMGFEDRASLYNKFFPLGYALLLKPFGVEGFSLAVNHINLAFLALLVGGLVLAESGKGVFRSLSIALFFALIPINFTYAIIASADMPAAALVTMAIVALRRFWTLPESDAKVPLLAMFAGLLFGLAALFRHHVLGLFLCVLIALALQWKGKNWRLLAFMMAGFLVGTLPQSVISILAGELPFQSDFKIMVYRVIHGLNFNQHPASMDMSVIEIITMNPLASFYAALKGMGVVAWYALPAAGLWAITDSNERARFARFSLFVIMAYSVVTSLGGSERAPLIIVSLYVLCGFWLVEELLTRLSKVCKTVEGRLLGTAGIAGLSLFLLLSVALSNYQVYAALSQRSVFYTELGSALSRQYGISAADEVFTDDLALYFPSLKGYIPRNTGGWAVYGLWGYAEKYSLPTDIFSSFIAVAKRQGIRYLLLSPQSGSISQSFAELYQGGKVVDYQGVSPRFVGQLGYYRVFEL